ncbi:MAG: TonB C-terminal domain-containing protein [Azoarcus sp.]|jgi:colicin import membrane protein|nr:TonB C-terminal domain-containing protein [Azoarcus sp.]
MNDLRNDFRPSREQSRKFLSLILTIAVHIGLLVFLFFGVNWQSQPLSALEVGLVSAPSRSATRSKPPPVKPPEPVNPPPEPIKPPEPVKPPPEPVKPPPEPVKPPPEPVKPPTVRGVKPEISTRAPKQKQPTPRREQTPKPLEMIETNTSSQIDRALQQRDEEKKVNELLSENDAGLAGKLDDAYQREIAAKVRGNLVRPPNLSGNPEAIFEIDQGPDGTVFAVRRGSSSGNQALDEAIERAINRSSPLPLPAQGRPPRTLTLKFRPLEK